jgi:Putative DNA-binding domain
MPLESRDRGSSGEPSYAAAFSCALLDPDVATPTVVAGPKSKAAVKRYNVYRNNVTVSLINALAAAFPATLRISGVDFFRAMARFYVRATPPTSPLLFDYGQDFPDFIERYEYAQSVPCLADVARIERAWLDAYHAADVQPLMPHDLAAIPSERLPNTVLRPHPATRVIRSRFSAVTIFTASRSDSPASRVEVVEPQDALLTRPALEVEVRRLPAGGAIFLSRLMTGEPLGAAASAAFSESPSFDLPANIRGLLEASAFTTVLCGES